MTEQDAGDQAGPRGTFHPGSWYAVSGARTTVLLPPALRHRVADLWEMVDEGADFDDVLDVLIAQGLRELPGFALIGEIGGTTLVLLRGAVTATLESNAGEVFLDGATASTWVEQSAVDVTRLVVELEPTGNSSSGALHAGVVQVGRIELVAGGMVHPERALVVDDEVALLDPLAPEDPIDPVDPVDMAPLDTEDLTGIEAAGVTTQAAIPVPQPVLIPEPVPVPIPEPTPEPSHRDQEPTEPFAPPQSHRSPEQLSPDRLVPEHPSSDDHDGITQSGTPAGDFERAQPGIPGQQHPPSVVSRPVARLLVSNGDVVEVDRVVLVGRAPEGRRFSSTEQPALISVDSPLQEISSTHLEVRPGSGADHGSAVVTDLGSTNGTVLVQPGLPPESMQPGIAVQLIPGAIIDLGDGVTIQVTNA